METKNTPNGLRYRETVYFGSRRERSPFFSRKGDANTWKVRKLNERSKMQALGEDYAPHTKLSLREYSCRWLEEKIEPTKSPSTYKDYERMLRCHLYPLLGKIPLKDVKERDADQLVVTLVKKGLSPKGIQNILALLKQLLNEAERRREISKNPLRHYRGPRVTEKEFSFWTEQDINKFLSSVKSHELYEFFVTALYTGMRKGEIAGLTWDCIGFASGLITVKGTLDKFGYRPTTKSGKIRHVPMNPFLRSVLQRMFSERKNDSRYVFVCKRGYPLDTNHLYRTFMKLQTRAKIKTKLRVHDLRHTFASQFMMKNLGSLFDLSRILGHADAKMTQRYAHLSPQHLANITHNLKFGFEDDLSCEVTLIQPKQISISMATSAEMLN